METAVERLENNQAKVAISFAADEIAEMFKNAYRDVNKSRRIPGFRPGKAPRKVLENTFGKEYFAVLVAENIAENIAPSQIDDANVIFLGESARYGADGEIPVEGEDFVFTITGEVKPMLELTSYEPVEIELPALEATEEEIMSQIDTLREYYVEYTTLDRPAQLGDAIFANLVCTSNGEELPGLSGDERLIQLGHGSMPEAFDAGFVGKAAGDETVFDFMFDEDDELVEESNAPVHVEATIVRVADRKLPELTDEWVKERCGYDSIEDFRTRVTSVIVSQKADNLENLKERACGDALIERMQGEATEAVFESAKSDTYRDFFMMLQQNKLSLEQYCTNNNIAPQQVGEALDEQSERRANENLALDALARHLGLEADEAAVRREFEMSGAENPTQIMEEWRQRGQLSMIREGIVRNKAIEWAKNTAVVTVA